jgi:hypothetical protein
MKTHHRLTSRRTAWVAAAALVVVAFALAPAATGCGEAETGSSPAPAASPAQTTTIQTALEYKTYYDQVKPIYDEITTALSSLDGTARDLSETPDATWTEASDQIKTAADQLASATMSLEALTPPADLQNAQDAVVDALKNARSVLDTSSAYLDKRVADPNAPDIRASIEQEVTGRLTSAVQDAIAAALQKMTGGSPSPSATLTK